MEKIKRTRLKNLVIFGLLLLLAVSLAYLYVSMSKMVETPQTSQTSQNSSAEDKKSDTHKIREKEVDPEKLVKNSFTKYFNEVNSDDQEGALKTFKRYVTAQVAAELDKQEVIDPVLCTFTAPMKIDFSKLSVSKNISHMTVTTYFEGGTVQTSVDVDTKIGKIVSMQCLTTAG